ncbi:MAG TPA: hypothetical protein VFA04_02045 [Bryobacteraceae bacterium]|nr:hypothetical protein [Bryobacteraceae bacterium]
MKTPIAIAAALLGVAGLHAADASRFAGIWVMRLGERNLFVLTLAQDNGAFRGAFDRPAKLTSTGSIFADISSAVRRETVQNARLVGDALRLTITNANNPNGRDDFLMTLAGDRAELRPADIPPQIVIPPWVFQRASSEAKVATDWQPNRAYTAGDSDAPSTEMSAIYDEDQKARMAPTIDWAIVDKADAGRREQTRKLLASGALHTGGDFEHAAFIFQHGGSADDYLLAHTLALIAVSKGQPTAIWIAAATLDRYLQTIGRKQVYGTQFLKNAQQEWTQEPYDRTLISDPLRQQLGVSPQALQSRQLDAYEAQK